MSAPPAGDPREAVVLLHGVANSRLTMQPIARYLEAAGYRAINTSYPSRTVPLERLASGWLPRHLASAGIDLAPRVHFVVHSLGTLIVRHLLAHARPPNLGRSVFLGPPSLGSELADTGRPRWLFRLVVGVNLESLGRGKEAFWRSLPQFADYPLGILAGTARGNPFGWNLPMPNDGTVTVASTRIEGALDSITVPHSHTGMLFNVQTARQVCHFLRHGRFDRKTERPV